MLWRRRGVIMLTMAAAVLIALVYLMMATKQYTSTSVLQIRNIGTENANLSAENFLATEAEWIQSGTNLTDASNDATIANLPMFDNVSNVIKALRDGLSVEPSKKGDSITISFTSPSASASKDIVNAIVKAYRENQRLKRSSQRGDLEKTKQDMLEKLDTAFAKIQENRKENGFVSVDGNESSSVLNERVKQLGVMVSQANVEKINAQVAYEGAQERVASDPQLADRLKQYTASTGMTDSAQDVAALSTEMANVRQRISDLRMQFMADHPRVRAEQARLDQLTANYLATVRSHWMESKRREEQLTKALNEAQQQAIVFNEKARDLKRLEQDSKRIQDGIDELDRRINGLTIADGTSKMSIDVMEEAKAEETPSSPRKSKTLAIALALGLLGGIGLTVLIEFRDQRMRSADEVRASLGVAVLGVVPAMQASLSSAARGTKVQTDPTSDVAEAYRTVRTSIYFGLPHESLRTILVTSPLAGDGKSTLCSNLAITMAQAGRRVLVVDADLRLPSQHKIFDVESGPGFSGVLQGLVTVDNAIVHTGVDGLDLLPCGPLPRNPAEALNSQSFADVLADLASRYDHVLLDSPALMAVADARIASAWCDATVLVLHGQRSSRRMARMARDGLIAVGANLVGVVVNDVARGSDKHSFYADFGYGGDRASDSEHNPADITRETAKRLGESLKALKSGNDRPSR